MGPVQREDTMTKTKKQVQPAKPKNGRKDGAGAPLPPVIAAAESEELVVFAFRLTAAERELIHKAAGPARASRFVRAVALAAAGGDEEALLKLLVGPAPAIN